MLARGVEFPGMIQLGSKAMVAGSLYSTRLPAHAIKESCMGWMGLLSTCRLVRQCTICLGCCVEEALQNRKKVWHLSTEMVSRVAAALSADTVVRD